MQIGTLILIQWQCVPPIGAKNSCYDGCAYPAEAEILHQLARK
jgi:hypothetical protein